MNTIYHFQIYNMKIFKIISKYILLLALSISIFSPTITYAALDYSGLVQCDGVLTKGEDGRGNVCNFVALMSMINYLIKWLFGLTIPIFVGMCAYAGFLYMTPKSENRKDANKMLWKGIKGFALMLCAWFIVTTLIEKIINPELQNSANSLIEQNK